MANSLNFLNKPASPSPAKPIGPQPKPASTAAPKSAFLDKSNPWGVSKGAPAQPAYNPLPQNKPAKTQTPAKTQKRADIPTRGYSYTESDTASGRPAYVRRQENDNAQMAAQATAQRRAQAAAQPAPQPAPIQVVAPRPAGNQVPLGYVQPSAYMPTLNAAATLAQRAAAPAMRALNSWMAATMGNIGQGGDPYLAQPVPTWAGPQAADQPIGLYMPTPQQRAQAPKSREQSAAEAWQMAPTPEGARAAANAAQAGQRTWNGTPPPFYDPEARFDEYQANQAARAAAQQNAPPWQMAPTAEQVMATRAAQQQQNAATTARALSAPTPEGARAAANAAQSAAPAPTPATTIGQRPGSYGWQPPGPITVERQATAQRGQRPPYLGYAPPLYTDIGRRSMMTEQQLAAEDAYRQRDAAGGMLALRQAGTFRPWSSYTDAEKYYRRYGVMPQGVQAAPDTSGAAALAANEAQNARLYDEYWDRYRNVIRGRRWYGGTRPGQQETMYGTEMANALQGIGQPAAQGTAQAAAPVTVTTTGAWKPQPGVTQEALNNSILQQVNPAGYKAGKVATTDVDTVAQEIIKRYVSGINPEGWTLAQVGEFMTLNYKPPPGLEQAYEADVHWLGSMVPVQ